MINPHRLLSKQLRAPVICVIFQGDEHFSPRSKGPVYLGQDRDVQICAGDLLARPGLAGVDSSGSSTREKPAPSPSLGFTLSLTRPLLQMKTAGAGARLPAKLLLLPSLPNVLGRLRTVPPCPSAALGVGQPSLARC